MLLLSCYAKGAAYQSGIEQICKDDHHFQNLVDFNQFLEAHENLKVFLRI